VRIPARVESIDWCYSLPNLKIPGSESLDRSLKIYSFAMARKLKQRPGNARGSGKLPPPGFRSPVRISIDHEALAAMDKRAVGAQIAIGIVAGWLASWLVGGSGLLRYVITGLVGSLVGALVLERLGIDLAIRNPLAKRIVTATLGAVIVVLLARLIG
jgi:uncharacterized membrane protein YeaQ/YmgE (transglycosylase-associated protein family)